MPQLKTALMTGFQCNLSIAEEAFLVQHGRRDLVKKAFTTRRSKKKTNEVIEEVTKFLKENGFNKGSV